MTTLSRYRPTPRILAGMICLAATSPLPAADAFLSVPGLTGGAGTQTGYQGDVDLLSYSQSFSRNPATGATTCGAITFTKVIDSTSTSFLYAAVTGYLVPTATIYFPGIGVSGTYPSPYTITLTNVTITAISQGDTVYAPVAYNNIGIVETVSMQAQKFQFTFEPQTPIGQWNGPPKTVGFDCVAQKPF